MTINLIQDEDPLKGSIQKQTSTYIPPKQNVDVDIAVLISKIRTIQRVGGSHNILDRFKRSLVNRFYQKYLKQIPLIQRINFLLWRRLYPKYVNYLALFSRRKTKGWRPLIKLGDYIKKTGIPIIMLLEAEQVEASEPKVYPVEDQIHLASTSDSFTFPPIYVAIARDALVYGGTNLVFMENAVICHDLYDFERDTTSEELHGRHLINKKNKHLSLRSYDDMPETIQLAATFVDACAQNYAHWLTEVLPRITMFCAMDEFKNIPIIINSNLHENILESLILITGADREIIAIPVGRAIKVDMLYITSAVGYVPFGQRNSKLSNHSHGQFSPSALDLVRKKSISIAKKKVDHGWPQLIYLRRNSGTRRIANEAEIEEQFSSHGYVIVESEKLTFMQQIQLFSNAKEIASPTGAALANCIFCKPGTRIIVMMGKHDNMIYRYWVNMLAPIKIEVAYCLGIITAKYDLGMHGDYFINHMDVIDLFRSGK